MTVDYFLIMVVGCYTLFRIVELIIDGRKKEPSVYGEYTIESLVQEIDSLNDDLEYEKNPDEFEIIKKKIEIRTHILDELLKKINQHEKTVL